MSQERPSGTAPVLAQGSGHAMELVERLRSKARHKREVAATRDGQRRDYLLREAEMFDAAADEIERLRSQGGAPEPPMPDQKLLPCPFCNGEALLGNGGPGCHFVYCSTCNATSDDGTPERSIADWNRRATPPGDKTLREALEKIIERSENGELGSSKVRDMAAIARTALSHGEDDGT